MKDKNTVQPSISLEKKTYKVEEIAKILDISIRAAYNFCDTATDFIVLRPGPKLIRVNKQSFDKWFEGQI